MYPFSLKRPWRSRFAICLVQARGTPQPLEVVTVYDFTDRTRRVFLPACSDLSLGVHGFIHNGEDIETAGGKARH